MRLGTFFRAAIASSVALAGACATGGNVHLPGSAASSRPEVTSAVPPMSILWSATRRLTWPDFQAPPQMSSEAAAMTAYAITYEANCDGSSLNARIVSAFLPEQSWVKPTLLIRSPQSERALNHEQTHFDLSERKQAEEARERERNERARTELLGRMVFAQEDERRRIAREMHDQFGEQLTALGQRIRMLKEAAGGRADLAEKIAALEQVAQQLDRDVDHLVWELRPTALDDLGLRAALANYVQNWSTRVGISATLHTSGLMDDRLSSEAETALYRIAQEALTNVAKHARAQNVGVILERRTDQVLLIVEDDGVGFEPGVAERPAQGFGLVGMQERAGLVGATLEIESSAGRGTTVFVRMNATTQPASQPHHV